MRVFSFIISETSFSDFAFLSITLCAKSKLFKMVRIYGPAVARRWGAKKFLLGATAPDSYCKPAFQTALKLFHPSVLLTGFLFSAKFRFQ